MATNLSNLNNFFKENSSTISSDKKNNIDVEFKTINEIRKAAKEKGIQTTPLDIKSVIEHIFHIKICETDLGKSVSGFLEKIGDSWVIYINKYENEYRKRFTLAHELGHFISHKDNYDIGGAIIKDQIFFRDENTDEKEQQANNFAAELLMPEDEFKNFIKRGDNTILKLADRFQLSTAAVRYRAYKLGLISSY